MEMTQRLVLRPRDMQRMELRVHVARLNIEYRLSWRVRFGLWLVLRAVAFGAWCSGITLLVEDET